MKKLTDLRGKRLCLTKKHGMGWWTILSALHQESLIESLCRGFSGYFKEVCVVEKQENEELKTCCPKGIGDGETDVFRCLQYDGCDVAVVNYNALEIADGKISPKILGDSDFRSICDSERTTSCHWIWSYPNYLMVYSKATIPKLAEIYGVFFQLGQYFGKNSRKNNPMLEIFGPFHEVSNVSFKDTSTSFIPSDKWNRSRSYMDIMKLLEVCSKSASEQLPSITVSFVLSVIVLIDGLNYSRLR